MHEIENVVAEYLRRLEEHEDVDELLAEHPELQSFLAGFDMKRLAPSEVPPADAVKRLRARRAMVQAITLRRQRRILGWFGRKTRILYLSAGLLVATLSAGVAAGAIDPVSGVSDIAEFFDPNHEPDGPEATPAGPDSTPATPDGVLSLPTAATPLQLQPQPTAGASFGNDTGDPRSVDGEETGSDDNVRPTATPGSGSAGTPRPQQSATPSPEQESAPPGQGGTPPGQDGNPPPGQGGTPPGQDDNPPPGQGGTPPGQDDNPPPGQGGTPPGQDGNPPPGQDDNPPPGQGGTPPGQDGNPPPGQGGTPPGQDGNPPPGQGGTPPGQDDNPPPGQGQRNN